MLGGKFGPGNKVIGGYDFVGDNYNGKYSLLAESSSSNHHSTLLLGTNTPVPDNDPLDQCAGHGTHVAVSFSSKYMIQFAFFYSPTIDDKGIIGANPGNQFNISGVAYDSSLSAYRVFGCTGSVTDDSKSPAFIVPSIFIYNLPFFYLVIVEALLRGVADGQDILTLSLGGPDGWTESSSSVVASRIAASGKVVTIAAGNDVRPVSESFAS